MADYNTVKKITSDWILKGENEPNVFNKFISFWIPFNAFYSFRTSQPNDRNALNALIADSGIASTYASVAATHEDSLKKLQGICPVHNVGKPGQSLSLANYNNVGETLNLLYLIRCNLFHGDKGESEKRDLEVIQAATPVLEAVVKAFIKGHL